MTNYEKVKLWRQKNPEKYKLSRSKYDKKRNSRPGMKLYWRETKRIARAVDKILKQNGRPGFN